MSTKLVKELALESGFPEWFINHSGSKIVMSWDKPDATSVNLEKFAYLVAQRCCDISADSDGSMSLEELLKQQKLFGFYK